MVRTDKKSRAEQLATLYQTHTTLRLQVVHSGLSQRKVSATLVAMERQELDGIICVNMMGEGFNFPRLKIAAIHSPHKSLEVTLQFIGRFARTNAPDIGTAKFIAIPSEIEFERKRLFDEGAVWEEIIPDLAYGRIADEVHIREVLQEFEEADADDLILRDLSLYSIHPRCHVKIYDSAEPVDFRSFAIPDLGSQRVVYHNHNSDGSVLLFITRELATPKWSTAETLIDRTYSLFVLYYDAATRLLFINSSRSADSIYEMLSTAATADTATPLATGQVRGVVRDITNKRIFNVGMRNIQAANTRESYKILAASDAQIDPADARRYRQGHVFLGGEEGGARTTIGYSSGAKVWSSNKEQIPGLIEWCQALGRKIRTATPLVTHSGLDYLDAGRVVVDTIPGHLVYVQWNRDAFDFTTPVQVTYTKTNGEEVHAHILDLELSIDRANTTPDRVRIIVSADSFELPLDFTLADFFRLANPTGPSIAITKGSQTIDLIDYINEYYLDFYTGDNSLFSGNELFEPKDAARPIGNNQFAAWSWDDVDIESEINAATGRESVHERVERELLTSDATIIIYDHGPGEIADFITVFESMDATVFRFYHCKGSGAPAPGARVEDVYEVCGQAQKSVAWTSLSRFEARMRRRRNARFVRGTADQLREIIERAKDRRQRFEVKLVQPGVSREHLSPAMAECLGATNTHLVGVGIAPLEVITSA